MTKKKEINEPENRAMVIYTDGGARDFAGWGYHGYTYNIDAPAPKNSRKVNAPTKYGYGSIDATTKKNNPKTQTYTADTVVTPLSYYDAWGTLGDATNNVAEVKAITNAISAATVANVSKLDIYSDSQYAIKGINQYSDKWIKNNWIKTDGTEVKNSDVWKELLTTRDTAEFDISFNWVRGHSGVLGNEYADDNATRGVILNRTSDPDTSKLLIHPPAKYRKYTAQHNRFLDQSKWYFYNTPDNKPDVSQDGKHIYYMGKHGNPADDGLVGKTATEHTFSIVRLAEPDPALQILKNKVHETCESNAVDVMFEGISSGIYSDLFIVTLGLVLNGEIYHDLMTHGADYFYTKGKRNDLYHTKGSVSVKNEDGDVVTVGDGVRVVWQARPPKQADRMRAKFDTMAAAFNAYDTNDPNYVITDVTDSIFSMTEVKLKKEVKEVCVINPDIGKTSRSVLMDVGYNLSPGNQEPKTYTVAFAFGLDIPPYATLKNIAVTKPIVKVITWRESARGFRYAVVIDNGTDSALYCPVHTNLKVVAE